MLRVELRKHLADFELNIGFESGPGITALFGRSGAGKTMIVNMLAGLVTPDSGRIAVNGQVLFDSETGTNIPPEKRRLGYVFQEARLFPHLSVQGNLKYGMNLAPKGERRLSFNDVAGLLDIDHLLDRRPHKLSGGEKQRVAIGRALLANPRILLMDEPLASVDVGRRGEILPFIEDLRSELGIPIVYVSHSTDEIVRLADTVVIVDEGRIAALGTVEDVMSRLDLRPLTGRHDAGAVLPARVVEHDERYDLTMLEVPGGSLHVARLDLPPGADLRIRIRARDVALASERLSGTSYLNCFEGVVMEVADALSRQATEVRDQEGVAYKDVLLDIGCPLWARVTRRSAETMGLKPGKHVFALVKSAAIHRFNVGRPPVSKPEPATGS